MAAVPFLSLDLSPGRWSPAGTVQRRPSRQARHGNLLGEFYWETLSPWLGGALMLNTGLSPRDVQESYLWQILQAQVLPKYYLTKKACLGILRRSKERGKPLPPQLELALKIQAGLLSMDEPPKPPLAFHINQREEVIDLGETAGALMATIYGVPAQAQRSGLRGERRSSGMNELSPLGGSERYGACDDAQTFVSQARPFAAGFCAGAGASAGGVGYSEEAAPTLKASPSGNMMPSVLCLNDQGCWPPVEAVQHRPSRQARPGAMDVSTDCTGTLRAQEHGHQPLVFENHNLDARYDGPLDVAPTLCTRAGTGGNNLPLVAGALTAHDYKGADNIYAEQGKLIVEPPHLIRRLTPGECELLQGYPLGWTDLPGASDSARYRALGNSVAIPCVQYVLGGIAKFAEER